MTSSTSSSSISRVIAPIIVLCLCLAGLELTTRFVLIPASKDISRFESYSDLARKIDNPACLGLALVGNSTTEKGVDLNALRDFLSTGVGEPVEAEMFVADASQINSWYYMINRFFWRPGHRPGDLCVITYYNVGLADGRPEIGRLAQNFSTLADWPMLFREDLPDWSDRMDLVVSSFWSTFSARDRIKDRVMGLVVPGYKSFARRLNDDIRSHESADMGAKPPASPATKTYRTLARVLDEFRRRGEPLCVVAFPVLEPYELDPLAVAMIRDAGVPFLDLRKVEGLGPEKYEDDIHLNAEGRAIYTRKLAGLLAPIIKE